MCQLRNHFSGIQFLTFEGGDFETYYHSVLNWYKCKLVLFGTTSTISLILSR